MKLDHIGLNAVELDTEIAFFVDSLGLVLFQKWDSPRQAYVGSPQGPVIGLIENPGYDGSVYTMAHVALLCPGSGLRRPGRESDLRRFPYCGRPQTEARWQIDPVPQSGSEYRRDLLSRGAGNDSEADLLGEPQAGSVEPGREHPVYRLDGGADPAATLCHTEVAGKFCRVGIG